MENHESSMPEMPGDHSEVRTHAPTLLGADQPGEQGEVRLWAPNPWQRRASLMLVATGLLGLFVCLCGMQVTPGFGSLTSAAAFWNGIFILEVCAGAIAAGYAWLQLRRPRYITTDNAGIGITMLRGSRALRWTEIRSARSVRHGIITLQTGRGPLTILLHAYTEGLAEDLFAVIVNRANLYRSPDDAYQFLPEVQVRERFLARQRNAVLDRPPMPANRRFTNDRAARSLFAVAAILLVAFTLGAIWSAIWMSQTLDRRNFDRRYPWAGSRNSYSFIVMLTLREQLASRNFQIDAGVPPATGIATIWVNQPPGTGLATPDVPGYAVESTRAEWAPMVVRGARSSLYRYEVDFRPRENQSRWPLPIAGSLSYGSRKIVFNLVSQYGVHDVSTSTWMEYRNTDASVLPESGPAIGSLPTPRSWRYMGVAFYDQRNIASIRIEPEPAAEYFSPAVGARCTAVAAAWLPGRFKGDRVNCDLILRDGNVRHLVLSPGAPIKGVKVIWKLPAKSERYLPQGPI